MLNRLRHILIVLLLIVLPLGVFWQARDHDFVWDDSLNITENPHLDQVTASKMGYFWRKPYESLYIPLTYTVWAAVAGFAEHPAGAGGGTGFDPRLFHTINIALHVLSVVTVFAILKMLVSSGWAACGGALLFALHPVQVEPVVWVTGMKDVLSGLLSLVAVWQYLAYARAQALQSNRWAAWHYGVALAVYGLALLSKPAAVVVPMINLTLDYWVIRRPLRQSAVALAPWIFMAVPVIVVTKWAQPDVQIGFIPSLWARFLVAADALAFYLSKLAIPLRLGPDYGRLPEWVLRQGSVYYTWILACVLAALIWLWRDRKPILAAAAVIFVVGVLPVSGLVPFQFQAISTVADRYLYLALLGPALALAWLLATGPRLIAAVAALLLALLGVLETFQVRHWRNETTLFTHALNINSRSWISHNNLGKERRSQGKLDEAIEHYRQALLANPRLSQSYNNLANALAAKGELEKAVESYRKALEISPRDVNVHNNLGLVLVGQGKIDEASEHYREALKIDSAYPSAHFNLGNTLAMSGRLEEAIEHFRQALRSDPTFVPAHLSLGNTLAASGKLEQAIEHYRQALKIDPKRANVHYNLALALAGSGQMEEAIKELGTVLELENSAEALSQTHFSLGTIFAKQGHLDRAGKHFEQALKLKPDFARARHYLGRVVEARGDLNKAIDYYQQAIRSDPELAEAHQSLGQALSKQGRRDEAIEHYQIALRILKSRKASEGR